MSRASVDRATAISDRTASYLSKMAKEHYRPQMEALAELYTDFFNAWSTKPPNFKNEFSLLKLMEDLSTIADNISTTAEQHSEKSFELVTHVNKLARVKAFYVANKDAVNINTLQNIFSPSNTQFSISIENDAETALAFVYQCFYELLTCISAAELLANFKFSNWGGDWAIKMFSAKIEKAFTTMRDDTLASITQAIANRVTALSETSLPLATPPTIPPAIIEVPPAAPTDLAQQCKPVVPMIDATQKNNTPPGSEPATGLPGFAALACLDWTKITHTSLSTEFETLKRPIDEKIANLERPYWCFFNSSLRQTKANSLRVLIRATKEWLEELPASELNSISDKTEWHDAFIKGNGEDAERSHRLQFIDQHQNPITALLGSSTASSHLFWEFFDKMVETKIKKAEQEVSLRLATAN